jgi:hypothetical protein
MLRLQEECNGLAWPHQLFPFAYAFLPPFCILLWLGPGHPDLSQNCTSVSVCVSTWSTHLILLPVPFWLHSNGYACVNSFSVVICIYVRLNTCYLLWLGCISIYGYFKWQACNMNMVESLSYLPFSWQSSCFWIKRYTNNQRRSKKIQDSMWLKITWLTLCVCVCVRETEWENVNCYFTFTAYLLGNKSLRSR